MAGELMTSFEQQAFYEYELGTIGRAAGSFRFRYEDLWSGSEVDTYFSDSSEWVAKTIDASHNQAYCVRIVEGGSERFHHYDDHCSCPNRR